MDVSRERPKDVEPIGFVLALSLWDFAYEASRKEVEGEGGAMGTGKNLDKDEGTL